MVGIVRSELIRLRRRSVLVGWTGLAVLFTVLVVFVMFQVVDPSGDGATDAPGVAFPTAAELLSRSGIMAGLPAASSFLGVVTLSFWALTAAGDSSTGLIRVLVSAEPRRWRLLAGKWVALALVTAAVVAVVVVANLVAAPAAASAGGWSPDAWGTGLIGVMAKAALDLYLSLLVWGTVGLALAGVTRSAGIAIGVGVGWVLLVEAVITALSSGIGQWLPGTTLTALAGGGSTDLSYGGATGLGALYVAVALLASWAVFTRRDITE
ncbi:MAG TPA: ABC transporter permease subunit [Mycobacteriales bacterium]